MYPRHTPEPVLARARTPRKRVRPPYRAGKLVVAIATTKSRSSRRRAPRQEYRNRLQLGRFYQAVEPSIRGSRTPASTRSRASANIHAGPVVTQCRRSWSGKFFAYRSRRGGGATRFVLPSSASACARSRLPTATTAEDPRPLRHLRSSPAAYLIAFAKCSAIRFAQLLARSGHDEARHALLRLRQLGFAEGRWPCGRAPTT